MKKKKNNNKKQQTIWLATLGAAVAGFVSCSPMGQYYGGIINNNDVKSGVESNATGAYLAGRVAHIRRDFDNAANYYEMAMNNGVENKIMLNQLYLLLASQGRIDEAAEYAQKAIDEGSANVFAHMILAVKEIYNGEYAQSINNINKIDDPLYKTFITPMFNAWNYAGLNDKEKAFASLKIMAKEPSFAAIYEAQKAMLADYFGDEDMAKEGYEKILNNHNSELSLRMLDIITNFYIRSGKKDLALAMMDVTVNAQALDSLLAMLKKKIAAADPTNTKPILSSPKIGAAEALFAVVSSFRYNEAIDVAHMYTAMTIYLNSDYSTAKILLADIYETRDMYENANKMYDSINENDIGYYPSRLKKARNLIKMGKITEAEVLLRNLGEKFDSLQIYSELGDLLRVNNRYDEAVDYYDKALKKKRGKSESWALHYAKGIALERSGKWDEAEKELLKAYNIKKHYLVLNYLGYSWLLQGQHIEKALDFIVQAYNQVPSDGSVNDSLGFALYNLGYYDEALPYLEKAAEIYPASAVISSHLGDAYWFAGRKNEARFQWQHALTLKDDSGEIEAKILKRKIKAGITELPEYDYAKDEVEAIIKKIKKAN